MAIEQQSDQVLIEQIIKGNKEAYRPLVDRYTPFVFYIVRRYEKDEDEVEELAQQIFVKAYERLYKFLGNSKFSSWLYALANNHCKDHVRKIDQKYKHFSEMDVQQLEYMMPKEETPEGVLLKQEWDRLFNEAIDKLEGIYSESFLLRYQDGMTYKEMAEKLNHSVGTLKVRVHRARQELKNLMEENYG